MAYSESLKAHVKEYLAGRRCGKKGLPPTTNPYRYATVKRANWAKGWRSAQSKKGQGKLQLTA